MEAADPEILIDILKRLRRRTEDVASCRLVCRQWRELTDSVISRVQHDFLSCRPDIGKNTDYLEVRTSYRPVTKIAFGSPAGGQRSRDRAEAEAEAEAAAAAAAACRLLEYKAITPSIPALRHKQPVLFSCERRLFKEECLAVRDMAGTLRTLELSGVSSRTFSEKKREILCGAVADMRNLLTLKMPASDLSPRNVRTLAKNRTITRLDISQNTAGEEGCEALSRMASLRALDIGNNEIMGAGAHLSRLRNLSELNVNFNGMTDDDVGEMLSGLTSLTNLKTTWNECGARTKESLSRIGGLTALDVGFTGCAVAGAVPSLRRLQDLDFSFAGVSDGEAEHIARAPNIRTLKLSNNIITAEGVRAICAGLSETLTDLDLSWNGIGHGAAICIAQNLRRLRRLDVKRNDVLDVGAAALMDLPGLRFLNVSNNHVSGTALRNLRHRARSRPGFTLVAFNH